MSAALLCPHAPDMQSHDGYIQQACAHIVTRSVLLAFMLAGAVVLAGSVQRLLQQTLQHIPAAHMAAQHVNSNAEGQLPKGRQGAVSQPHAGVESGVVLASGALQLCGFVAAPCMLAALAHQHIEQGGFCMSLTMHRGQLRPASFVALHLFVLLPGMTTLARHPRSMDICVVGLLVSKSVLFGVGQRTHIAGVIPVSFPYAQSSAPLRYVVCAASAGASASAV